MLLYVPATQSVHSEAPEDREGHPKETEREREIKKVREMTRGRAKSAMSVCMQ